MSEKVDKIKEIQHVKQALKANNYPYWMPIIPNTGSVSRVSQESVNQKRKYTSVPCIKGTSVRLQRALKLHEVTLVHEPFNSLRSHLFRVKDKTENLKKTVGQCITSIANNVRKIMGAKLLDYWKVE